METRYKLVALCEDLKSLHEIEEIASSSFSVVPTRSAERVLALVNGDPSVTTVVVDHELNNGKGLDLLIAIQEARPSVRRVLISGPGHLADIIEGLHCGAIERILYKPIRANELTAAIAFPKSAAADNAKRATA